MGALRAVVAELRAEGELWAPPERDHIMTEAGAARLAATLAHDGVLSVAAASLWVQATRDRARHWRRLRELADAGRHRG